MNCNLIKSHAKFIDDYDDMKRGDIVKIHGSDSVFLYFFDKSNRISSCFLRRVEIIDKANHPLTKIFK